VQGSALPRLIGLLTLQALLALALERCLAAVHLPRMTAYRLAFTGSLAVSLAFFSWKLIISHAAADWLVLSSAIPGAFLGGLLATALRERLWEDNSPPSSQVVAEVLQLHRDLIGEPGAEPWAKRAFDLLLASFGLVVSAPVWLLASLLIWIEDPGPLLFVKNSVGKGGANFRQFKLRTMVREAEQATGPVLSTGYEDERALRVGRLLRKTALDELPQLINILKGEMSFVGPRPQRTVLVRGYLEHMPEYAERHAVLPGLAGLAQVAGDYYLTPRQKLRYDRLYIRCRGLGFDIQLILLAFAIAFWFRWRKDWNGRLPRTLFRKA
jgi:lipopolysaccharide/colanic/teichoic acid biosynthesis glycosyltransferase